MSDPQPPNPAETPVQASPLSEIDSILADEDPEFLKFLEQVRAVESDQNVVIDTGIEDENLGNVEKIDEIISEKQGNRFARFKIAFKTKVKTALKTARQRTKEKAIACAVATVAFLKTRPKDFLFYSIAISKILAKRTLLPYYAFKASSRLQKTAAIVLAILSLSSAVVLVKNFKGIWLPNINDPLLKSLADVAESVETFDPKDAGESFYSAFPKEEYNFLFPKIKVNLRRLSENTNPMGAFEVIVVLDSSDAAIEVRDRETEFLDHLQRVFEGEPVTSLASEYGKAKVKNRIKREFNTMLTQGWIMDVRFKTFILKP